MSRLVLLAAVLAALAGPLDAQAARELQIQAVGTFASTRFFGGGVGFALRSQGRTRLGLSVSGGDISQVPADSGVRTHAFGGRAELMASYHVNPFRRSGLAPYGGGGVAVAATADDMFEYVLLVIGIETSPGGASGWFAELGLGGGVRVSAGFRTRWR